MDTATIMRVRAATGWRAMQGPDHDGHDVWYLIKPCGRVATRGEIDAVLLTLEKQDGRRS